MLPSNKPAPLVRRNQNKKTAYLRFPGTIARTTIANFTSIKIWAAIPATLLHRLNQLNLLLQQRVHHLAKRYTLLGRTFC